MVQLVRDSTSGVTTYNKLPWVNMLPLQAQLANFPSGFGTDTLAAYRAYLDEYLSRFNADAVPAPILSFDNYPFQTDYSFRRYFQQLAIVRDKAAEYSRANYRMPFWSTIQCGPYNLEQRPTFAQIRWQAYASLAYGAKGSRTLGSDVYAQRVLADGQSGTTVDVPHASPPTTHMTAFPNPANVEQTISFVLKQSSNVTLEIIDTGGNRRAIVQRRAVMSIGEHAARWNCRDEHGQRLPPGVYYAVLKTDHGVSAQRIIVWR